MKRKLAMMLLCMMMSVVAMAQSAINGTVVSSADGEPVPGATVKVKGTSQVVVTNGGGRFTINVKPGTTLVVSYIGMRTQQVAAKNGMRVELDSEDKFLDDVVVVGYGTQKREAKTGAITSVSSEEIADIPASSIDKMLAGKLAGVSISQSSGQPGSSTSIRVRGTSSINAGNNPLYVVDGIAIMSGDDSDLTNTTNAIALINPDDIESITVLKDAAAASLYGSRAANGVILITTKSGREGKSQFTVRAKYGVSSLANDNDFGLMNSKELLEYQRQAVINAGKNPDDPTAGAAYYRPYELLTRPQTNWMDHLTRLGEMAEVELNMSGGNSKTKYYNSISYHKNDGVFYGIDFNRIQARVNVDHQISKTLSTGTRLNLGYTKSNDVPMQSLYYSNPAFAGMTILPWTPAYNEDGTHNSNIPENSNTNPRATAKYDEQFDQRYALTGSLYLQWKPIRQLTLKTNDAVDIKFADGRRYWSLEANNYDEGYPILQTTQTKYRRLTTSNTAVFEDIYNENHNVRVLLGQEAIHHTSDQNYQMSEALNPDIPYHPSGSSESFQIDYSESTWTMMSWFAQASYNYASRYYLDASIRTDGCSLFGKNNQWGTFGSVSASWNIHNEKFMENVDWLEVLKLRASYGVTGNNNISNYMQYGTYTTTGYNGITGMRPSTPANDDLSWEKSKSWNVGLDFHFLKRFSGSIDVYTRKTTDMLLDKSLSSTTGFNSATMNIGSLRNSGIEFQFDANIIDNNDWKWDAGFNIAHNKSKVLELADDEMMDYSEDSRLKHIVGEKLFTFYLKDYYGVNPVNGEALFRTEDGELTNDYNAAAYIKAGSPEPTFTGGINTTLSYKNLALSVVGEFKGGNKVMIIENRYLMSDGNQMSMNQSKHLLNYWKKPGDTGCNPKPVAGNTSNSYSFGTDRFVQDGGYFRIKDITLSYSFPKSIINKAGISNLKVYGSALNLYTFHKVDFWDPERGVDGMGYGIYPQTKTFVVGLDLTF